MLAQNFKTPAALSITDAEFDALVQVLGMLERGELNHVESPNGPTGFNMAVIKRTTECGTVACIYGWAKTFDETTFAKVANDALMHLFCAYHSAIPMQDIRVDQASIALRNYLTFGEPRWDEALADATL